MRKGYKKGFTLIELLVTLTVVSILVSVVTVNFIAADRIKNDTKRKADLTTLQSAVELYKNQYGRYPDGCNGPGVWSGQLGTSYACNTNSTANYTTYSGTGDYIIGHEAGKFFAPEFITVLPKDPRLNGIASGYVYTVDVEGMVYKIMALDTVESEIVTPANPLDRCGGDLYIATKECVHVPDNPTGNYGAGSYNSIGGLKDPCRNTAVDRAKREKVYAVWGGYANGGIWTGLYRDTEKAREYFSDIIRCK